MMTYDALGGEEVFLQRPSPPLIYSLSTQATVFHFFLFLMIPLPC